MAMLAMPSDSHPVISSGWPLQHLCSVRYQKVFGIMLCNPNSSDPPSDIMQGQQLDWHGQEHLASNLMKTLSELHS